MRWLGALALLAGCDRVFDIDYVDAGIDSRPDAPPCAMPAVSDDFASGQACATWGFPFPKPNEPTLASGDLVLAPDPALMQTVGCVSQTPFPFGETGVFVEVDAVGTGDAQYNTLIMWWDTGLTVPTTLQVANGVIAMADRNATQLGMAPYDPIAMRWLRLRPSATGMQVIGDTSPDGIAWTELARESRTAVPMIRAQIQSGTNGATNATAMRVASFDVCP